MSHCEGNLMATVHLQKNALIGLVLAAILLGSVVTISLASVVGSGGSVLGQQGPKGEKGDTGDTGATGATGTTGATGQTGATGAAGAAGKDGSVWYNGTGNPSAKIGVNGDYYLNLGNGDVYNKIAGSWVLVANIKGTTGATGETGATGIAGTAGANGNAGLNGTLWNYGSGIPASSLGVNGDFYLNTANSDVYTKVSGVWVQVANLKGAVGVAGPAGADGNTWYSGSGTPANTIGNNGDYYLNTANCDIYKKISDVWIYQLNIKGATGSTGPTGATGDSGATGATGSTGANGATWHSGSGVPSTSLGVNGDFYFDQTTNNVYNKISGIWTIVANLKGAKGDTGEQGPYLADYDSGWVNISDRKGAFTLTHSLNTQDVQIQITGKDANGVVHQKALGLNNIYTPMVNKTYGTTTNEQALDGIQTSTGDYILIGTVVNGSRTDDYFVKTDTKGNLVWEKTFYTSTSSNPLAVVEGTDGNYVICGYGYANLLKIDTNGNQLWRRTFTISGVDFVLPSSVVCASDGGFIIIGTSLTYSPAAQNIILIKTDSNGNVEWNQRYSGGTEGTFVALTPDGGYAIAGVTSLSGAGGNEMYLIKTDSSGNLQWAQTYGGTGDESAAVVTLAPDGGYALAGKTNSFGAGNTDMYLVKAGSDGAFEWSKTFGGTGQDECQSLIAASEGGYVLAGTIYSATTSNDAAFIKTDASGNMEWTKTYGGTYSEAANKVIETTDGGYALIGYSSSYGAGVEDFWLLKDTVLGEFGLANIGFTANTITLYRGYNDIYWEYVRVQMWKIE